MVEGGWPSQQQQQQQQQQSSSSQTKQLWTDYYITTPDIETPTVTDQEPANAAAMPPRPKIVVFGASGRNGRRIVKKLLASGADVDVVAFVRDSKKLERVLYDEEDLAMEAFAARGRNKDDVDGSAKRANSRNDNGPSLQVIVADLVSRRDVRGRSFESEGEKKLLDSRVRRAKRHFATKGWNYFNATSDAKTSKDIDILESGGEEALRDAIAGATVIISCLGTFRPSNFWMDYLCVPIVRIFRMDAGKWCSDPTHPYYVNYLTTKKILEEAEKEQRRRAASLELERERFVLEEELRRGRERWRREKEDEEEGFEKRIAAGLRNKRNNGVSENRRRVDKHIFGSEDAVALPESGRLPSSHDRIKFIRISHLMVGQSPFRVRNCLTNIFWSQLSRFELMGENLMRSADLVDTIVLRPGPVTDDQRNLNHTSLQLCIDGTVRSPSLVGRDDVADVAVVAALTKITSQTNNTNHYQRNMTEGIELPQNKKSAHHFTWALRWTGQHISPPQGLRPDGFSNAALCFADAIQKELKAEERRNMNKENLLTYMGGKEWIKFNQWRHRLKPYSQSLAISIPIYATIGFLTWYLVGQTIMTTFWRLKQLYISRVALRFFR